MSDEESMGDEVYQPTGEGEDQGDATELDMEDALGEDDYDQELDKGYSPPERPYAVNADGTTAAEQREGESLDERLAEEVPDVRPEQGDGIGDSTDTEGEPLDPEAGDRRAGRLVAPDEGSDRPVQDGEVAEDVGIDGGAAGAEEAAVHIVEDPE
ncbi:DUF5709 domain-containing protein [Streptomyces sp. NBC_01198]|uniref:DUF5709 domain-containing protein n=1 Tax=Streptomyces sp. NBC_01198 TaxID=2903769 RepID=UPI002E15718E|nr:DUF5709 domain-containing protein [Streptomyces sp. NBC_01198]